MIQNSKFTQTSKEKKGFTLVEILLAASIFVILMSLGITAFSTIIKWKKNTGSVNDIQGAGRHAMEVMTMAVKQSKLSPPGVIEGGETRYGFRIISPTELKVYGTPDYIFSYDSANKKIKKGSDDLTPSNISVESLAINGYEKTDSTLSQAGYQQPFVSISMKLKSKIQDPQTHEFKEATFQTTVSPQNFDSLGYAEIQSGVGTGANQSGNTESFNPSFSKPPVVVTARERMNEDDDDTRVYNITTNDFQHGVSNIGTLVYWLAVNGDFPNSIKSGKVNAFAGAGNRCTGGENAVCVNYKFPFKLPVGTNPVTVIMREFLDGNNDPKMNYVYANTKYQFKISGNSWGGNGNPSNYDWVSVNPALSNVRINSQPLIAVGRQGSANNFGCPVCTYTYQLGTQTYTGYMCAFRDHAVTWPNPSSAHPAATANFPFMFSPEPRVIVSASTAGILDYSRVPLSAFLNTPGIDSITPSHFIYTNIGGGISDNLVCEGPPPTLDQDDQYTASQRDYVLANFNINWMAVSQQNFKLTWSYK